MHVVRHFIYMTMAGIRVTGNQATPSKTSTFAEEEVNMGWA